MQNIQILEKIKNIFIGNDITLSVAESCTGGLISSYLTDINGASKFIKQNFVTYSEDAKNRFLDVKMETIKTYSVVSKQVAYEMAKGLLKYADAGLTTTGILGPDGGSDKTPIGTVFIGIAYKNSIEVFEYHSKEKTRTNIKKDMANYALHQMIDFIQKNVVKYT